MQNLVLTQLSTTDLKNLFEETLQTFFAEKQISDNLIQKDEIGGIELAVEVTGLARATIYSLCCNRKLPHSKQNKKLYFSRAELSGWIKDGKRKTNSELALEAENFSPNSSNRKTTVATHKVS